MASNHCFSQGYRSYPGSPTTKLFPMLHLICVSLDMTLTDGSLSWGSDSLRLASSFHFTVQNVQWPLLAWDIMSPWPPNSHEAILNYRAFFTYRAGSPHSLLIPLTLFNPVSLYLSSTMKPRLFVSPYFSPFFWNPTVIIIWISLSEYFICSNIDSVI